MSPRPPSSVRRRAAAIAALAGTLAIAGCGSGGGGHARHHSATTDSRSTTTSTASATTRTVTVGTSTETTTVTLPGTGRPTVTIGDKNYTEQFVLGELYQKALQAQGFSVDINQNIGPPDVVRGALRNGTLAMYPEYLDVVDQTLAGYHRGFHTRDDALAAARRWAARNELVLLDPTPFSDTTGIAVTVAYAAAHRLRAIGDLAHVDGAFTIGGEVQLRTAPSGLPALSRVYGVTPEHFTAVAVGSQYGDLATGAVQAAYVNTTDGELASGDYRVLSDPRRIFGFGNVVPVVSAAVLAKEGPAFAETIERVNRTLTLPTMIALNNAADATGASPAQIATRYLQTHGLLSPLPTNG